MGIWAKMSSLVKRRKQLSSRWISPHPTPPHPTYCQKTSSVATAKCLVVLIKVEYKAAIEGVILGLVGNHTLMMLHINYNEAMT